MCVCVYPRMKRSLSGQCHTESIRHSFPYSAKRILTAIATLFHVYTVDWSFTSSLAFLNGRHLDAIIRLASKGKCMH